MPLIKADVQFKVNGKQIKFSIVHDMPETFGLSFNDALHNWLARTNSFTANSLCNYIKSKNTGCIAMTESQYSQTQKS